MQRWPESHSKAWLSRFWAEYGKLPEQMKEGFNSLAQSVAKAAECQEKSFDINKRLSSQNAKELLKAP